MRIKIPINIILSIISLYCLYAGINYLISFLQNPVLIGGQSYYFLGNIMLLAVCIAVLAISLTLLVFINKRRKENNL